MTPDPNVWLSHMSWYVTPGAFKDGAGASGGTVQSRITCLHGDTLVLTSEGPLPIKEATQRDVDVLTQNIKTGVISFVKAKPVFGGRQQLFKITYKGRKENKLYVLATAEHRWVKRDGTWVTTNQLRKGTSLRHVYLYTDHHGYPRVHTAAPWSKMAFFLHRLNLPGYEHVHHKNEVKDDWRRSNLEGMTRSAHISLHKAEMKNKVTFNCQNCNKEVTARKSVHRHRFCTKRCWYEFRKGNYQVKSVEPWGVGEVYCFEVPGTETFILGDGLVSGNCKKGSHQTDPPEVQDCWRSRWEGGYLISYDLKQIELCVAGLLSGEPFICDAVRNGWDLHSRRALKLWKEAPLLTRYPSLSGISVDSWKKNATFNRKERQVGKRVNFADLFRSGAATMQSSVLGDIGELLPLHFFQSAVDNRQRDLPLLWAWQEARIAEARRTGQVTLPFTGQSRAFLGGDKYDVNEIVNFPVQATASNTLLRIQIRLHTLLRAHPLRRSILPVLNIYDALKFDCQTLSAVHCLHSLYEDSLLYVRDQEYWSWLQDLHNRTVPIEYERAGYQHGEEVKDLKASGPAKAA